MGKGNLTGVFGLMAAVFSAQSAMAQVVKGSPDTYSGDTAARA